MSQVLIPKDELEVAKYLVKLYDPKNFTFDSGVLYMTINDGKLMIHGKNRIHLFLISRHEKELGKWLSQITKFNKVYQMLCVLSHPSF